MIVDARMMVISSDLKGWWSTAKKETVCSSLWFDDWLKKMIHPPLTWQWPIRHLWSDRHLYVYKLNGWCLTRNPKSNCKDQLARGAQRQRPFSSWAKSQHIDPGLERQGLLMNMWCVYPTIFKYICVCVCGQMKITHLPETCGPFRMIPL